MRFTETKQDVLSFIGTHDGYTLDLIIAWFHPSLTDSELTAARVYFRHILQTLREDGLAYPSEGTDDRRRSQWHLGRGARAVPSYAIPVLKTVSEHPDLSLGELVEVMSSSRGRVRQLTNMLTEAGLVVWTKQRRCRVTDKGMARLGEASVR